jgi:hypothetical protein
MACLAVRGRQIWAVLLGLPLVGCAQLQGPVERTDRTVLQTVEERRAKEGEFVLVDMVVEQDRIKGVVKREQFCETVTLRQIEHQRVEAYSARNVGLDIGGGAMLGLGGVGLMVTSPGFSDEPRMNEAGEELATNREVAMSAGILLLAAGAWAMVHGVRVQAKTGDRVQGRPWTTFEETSRTGFEPCGLSGPVPGVVEMSHRGRTVGRMSFPGGDVDIDLRGHTRLCRDKSLLGAPVRLVYHAEDKGGGSVSLGEHDLDACIIASDIDQGLAKTREALDRVSAPFDLAEVAVHFGDITRQLQALPATDRDYASLFERHRVLKSEIALATEGLLQEVLGTYRDTLAEAGPHGALPYAAASLALSRIVDGQQAATWARVYSDYVDKARRKPADNLAALEALLNIDEITRDCLVAVHTNPTGEFTSLHCPFWLGSDLVRDSFKPLTTALGGYVTEHRSRLDAATKRLERQASEANFAALGESFEESEGALEVCGSELWSGELGDVCQSLESSREDAIRVARESRGELEKRAIRRTAESWRQQFPLCRKVADGADAFRNVTHCDASCRQIRERIIADHTKLRDFSVADATWDAETLSRVRSECQAARCPRCP